MPVMVRCTDKTVYPVKRDPDGSERSIRVTIRSDRIAVANAGCPGMAEFRRSWHRGRWVYTDLRDNARVDEPFVIREIARIAFRGDRERAAAALRAARGV